MAMESIGLGGKLLFDPSQGVAGMKTATRAYERLQSQAGKASTGMSKAMSGFGKSLMGAGEGFQRLGMAGAPVTLAMGAGVLQAANFEQQMSNLRAVMGQASDQEFKMLQDEAKRLGIVSVFSATQAGEAMQNLSTLGFEATEIMGAIKPTLDAAAVGGIDLASAAQYVGGSLRAMGEDASQAGRIADVLTVAGQKSATTLPLMAEALAYGGAAAKKWGMDVEETVAILGKFADRMHQGSTGGMLLMNIVDALTDPTDEAKKALKDLGVTTVNATNTGFRPLGDVVADIRDRIAMIPEASERARVESLIFSQRAGRAYADLSAAGTESINKLTKNLREGLGASEKAANIRLDNMKGAFTLFGASIEGLSIGVFDPLLNEGKTLVQSLTSGLNDVLLALSGLNTPLKEGQTEMGRMAQLNKQYGEDTVAMAQGVKEAIEGVKLAFKDVRDMVAEVGQAFGKAFTGDNVKEISRLIVKGLFLVGIMSPLLLTLLGVTYAFKGLLMVLAPIPKALMLVWTAFQWTRTGGLLLLKDLWILIGVIRINFIPLMKMAGTAMIGFFASPIGWVVAALGVLMVVMKATQMQGEGFIESFVNNWTAGFKVILEAIKGFVKSFWGPISWLLKAVSTALQAIPGPSAVAGKALGAVAGMDIDKVFGGTAPKAEAKRAEAKGWRVAAREGVAKVEPTAIDELQKEIGMAGQGQMEKWAAFQKNNEKMLQQMMATAEAAKESAKESANAAKEKRVTKLNIDGREVGRASSKHQGEVQTRSGTEAMPWQRRNTVINGATRVSR